MNYMMSIYQWVNMYNAMTGTSKQSSISCRKPVVDANRRKGLAEWTLERRVEPTGNSVSLPQYAGRYFHVTEDEGRGPALPGR